MRFIELSDQSKYQAILAIHATMHDIDPDLDLFSFSPEHVDELCDIAEIEFDQNGHIVSE